MAGTASICVGDALLVPMALGFCWDGARLLCGVWVSCSCCTQRLGPFFASVQWFQTFSCTPLHNIPSSPPVFTISLTSDAQLIFHLECSPLGNTRDSVPGKMDEDFLMIFFIINFEGDLLSFTILEKSFHFLEPLFCCCPLKVGE